MDACMLLLEFTLYTRHDQEFSECIAQLLYGFFHVNITTQSYLEQLGLYITR